MSTITVRLNKDEARVYKEYAEFKNVALSTLMKETLEEKIRNVIWSIKFTLKEMLINN